jgi:hypothetical protein
MWYNICTFHSAIVYVNMSSNEAMTYLLTKVYFVNKRVTASELTILKVCVLIWT